MRRAFIIGLVLFCQVHAVAFAEPLAQECSGVVVSSPSSGDAVRGRINITGSAAIPQFQFYKVEVAPGASPPDSAFRNLAADVHRTAVQGGVLDAWDTTGAPDGTYAIRLTVVDQRGNFPCPPVTVRIVVANRAPTNTPTPSTTDTPTATPVGTPSPQATGAPTLPAAPTIALPTSSARGTDTITATTGVSSTASSSRQILNLDLLPGIGQACVLGAITMAAVFMLFGVLNLARWVLDQI